MGTNVESRLSEMLPTQLGELSILERKVSTYLLKHEDKLMEMDIAEIAKASGVSKATVVRFCKALGFKGLKDFKIYYEAGKSQYSTKITKLGKDVSSSDVMSSMKNGFIRAIEKSLNDDNLAALENIAAAIEELGKITILYDEGRFHAEALAERLNSMGFNTTVSSVAKAIESGDVEGVVIIISHTGDIDGLGAYCKKAKENGARLESITSNPKSWISANSENVVSLFNEKLLNEDKYLLSNCALTAVFEILYVLLVVSR